MILRYILLAFSAFLSSSVCFAETADEITYRDVTAAGTLVVRRPINDADFNTLWGAVPPLLTPQHFE